MSDGGTGAGGGAAGRAAAPGRRPWRRAWRAAGRWRGEGAFRRRLKDVGYLLTGNSVAMLIGLAAFALTARALGPAEYGVLAMLHAYTRAVERFVGFQSWQPVIKYGAELQEQGRREDMQALLKLGLLLDLGAAAAGWALALSGILLAGPWFGWSGDTLTVIAVYCTVLLFTATGTPTAVLRLSGRFRTVAVGQSVNAALRLALCGLGAALGGGLLFFALVWMGMRAVGSLATLGLALRELRRQRLLAGLARASLRGFGRRFPGLWNFAWSTNLSLTIRASASELDTLIVGALADTSSAGLYHIAKRVGRMAQQVGVQVQTVLYPDVARLWAGGMLADFRRAVLQVEVMLAGFGLACFVFFLAAAEPFLRWTAGPAFLAAAPLLVVQMLAAGLVLAGSALRSALLAMGMQRQVLTSVLVATAAFHLTAFALIPWIGAMGANLAHIVLGAVAFVGMTVAFRRGLALTRVGAASAGPAPVPGPS